MNYNVGHRKPLVENLLLIDGISRSGKFLLANILSGLHRIEPVQYYGLLEHIPFLVKFGLIDKKAGKELLQCEIDTHCYEMLIGRNLNHRMKDKSSIFNVPKYKDYLKRCEEGENIALARFYKNKPFSLFIMHELMPNISIYFETFPKLHVLSIKRSPIGLVYSWYKRGLAKRLGEDPLLFMVPFRGFKRLVPWFALEYKAEYDRLKEIDRTILSIAILLRMYRESYNKLPLKYKKRILFLNYEEILLDTKHAVREICKFLKRKPLPAIHSILKREKLPQVKKYEESTDEKLKEIKKIASKKYFQILLDLEKGYHEEYKGNTFTAH